MTDYIDVLRRVEPLRRDRNRIVERLEQLRSAAEGLTRTVRDGLTLFPPIETRPFLQASAASDRVLKSRTAHIHLSILTSSISCSR